MIHLSFPPSTNTLWRSVKGRNIMSEGYRRWKANAIKELLIQRPEKVRGPYTMTVVATRPDNRRRDLSNIVKALEDTLVSAGIIEDDSLATSILLRWSEGAPDKMGGVRIVVEAA